jgi:hypothetical protein
MKSLLVATSNVVDTLNVAAGPNNGIQAEKIVGDAEVGP